MSSDATPNGARALWWYALALIVIGLDQYTKGLASGLLDYGRPVEVFFWFDLTLQHNSGAAFSFLSSAGGWQRWYIFKIHTPVKITSLYLLLYVIQGRHNGITFLSSQNINSCQHTRMRL